MARDEQREVVGPDDINFILRVYPGLRTGPTIVRFVNDGDIGSNPSHPGVTRVSARRVGVPGYEDVFFEQRGSGVTAHDAIDRPGPLGQYRITRTPADSDWMRRQYDVVVLPKRRSKFPAPFYASRDGDLNLVA